MCVLSGDRRVCVRCLEIEASVCSWRTGLLPPSATSYCMDAWQYMAPTHFKGERHPSARLPSYLKTHHVHIVSPADNMIRSPITTACINFCRSKAGLLDQLMLCGPPCCALNQNSNNKSKQHRKAPTVVDEGNY